MHCDYGNHTLAYPPDDPAYWQTAYLLYYTEVTAAHAPTAVCSRRHYPERILWPAHYKREQRPAIYDNERKVIVPAGSLFIYSMRTFHRGTPFRADVGRLAQFVTYAPAAWKWLGIVGWSAQAIRPEFRAWIEAATPAERELLGFPPPGPLVLERRNLGRRWRPLSEHGHDALQKRPATVAMTSYFVRRFLLILPTFLGVTVLVFTLTRLVPGGPIERMLNEAAMAGADNAGATSGYDGHGAGALSDQQIEELKAYYGFDKPVLVAYADWLGKVLTLDLGTSTRYSEPVWETGEGSFAYFHLLRRGDVDPHLWSVRAAWHRQSHSPQDGIRQPKFRRGVLRLRHSELRCGHCAADGLRRQSRVVPPSAASSATTSTTYRASKKPAT